MHVCGVYCSQTQLSHYFIMGCVLKIHVEVISEYTFPIEMLA